MVRYEPYTRPFKYRYKNTNTVERKGSTMKFFIDTANVEDIRKANDMGVICGVTTNPSLIAKEGRDFKEVIKEITTKYHISGVDAPRGHTRSHPEHDG